MGEHDALATCKSVVITHLTYRPARPPDHAGRYLGAVSPGGYNRRLRQLRNHASQAVSSHSAARTGAHALVCFAGCFLAVVGARRGGLASLRDRRLDRHMMGSELICHQMSPSGYERRFRPAPRHDRSPTLNGHSQPRAGGVGRVGSPRMRLSALPGVRAGPAGAVRAPVGPLRRRAGRQVARPRP